MKFVAILLIMIGEAIGILAELWGVRIAEHNSTLRALLRVFAIMAVAGSMLIAGYIIGYKAFNNIWIVSALSITTILIVEPLLNMALFQDTPTRGALIGFALGAIGLISTVFIE